MRHSDSTRIFQNKLFHIEQNGLDEHQSLQFRDALTRLHFVEVFGGAAGHGNFIGTDVLDVVIQQNLHVDVVLFVLGEVTFEDEGGVAAEKLN